MVTIFNLEISFNFSVKVLRFTQTSENTEYNTKFTLLEGPKIYVLESFFREISPKFEKSPLKSAYVSCKVITYGYHLSQYLPSKVSHFREFPFVMLKLDDHLNVNTSGQKICCVCIESRAILKLSEG